MSAEHPIIPDWLKEKEYYKSNQKITEEIFKTVKRMLNGFNKQEAKKVHSMLRRYPFITNDVMSTLIILGGNDQ